jgi:hypothetical protein
MARFKYLGEPPRDYVVTVGPCLKIRAPLKNGTLQNMLPVPPATEFVIGQDIGHDITDQRALISMRADPRFEELP